MRAASELIETLRTAQTPAAVQHAVHQLEDNLTPRELAGLLPALNELSGLSRLACESSSIIRELHGSAPQPYVRSDLAAGVALFSAIDPPRKDKSLIIAL